MNQKWMHQKPLHSLKGILCTARGIIGPYFPEDEWERAVTVNSIRYVEMLYDFSVPEQRNITGYNPRAWFQQDGPTSHKSIKCLPRFREIFPCKLISRRGNINCSTRSPYSSLIHVKNPSSLAQLRKYTRYAMAAIHGV